MADSPNILLPRLTGIGCSGSCPMGLSLKPTDVTDGLIVIPPHRATRGYSLKTQPMSKDKPTTASRAKKKAEVSLVRSSAAEYLTFVAAGGESESSVEMRYEDENIWLTQRMMAELYWVSIPAINQHLKRIFSDNELEESAVIKQYLTTAADGKAYQTKHYSLQAIIAVVSYSSFSINCRLRVTTSEKR